MNDVQLKLARVCGEFVWHRHDDTDEAYLVAVGRSVIETKEGQTAVIPKGFMHRPVAAEGCRLMLVEPVGVVNTGDAETDRTAPNAVWV